MYRKGMGRRALVASGLGAGLVSMAALAQTGHSPLGTPTGGTPEGGPTVDPWATESPGQPTETPLDKQEYVGWNHGAEVTWDFDVFEYAGDETTYPENEGDDFVFLRSLTVYMVTFATIRFREREWTSLDEAKAQGYDAFLAEFSTSGTELVGSWSTDVAAGFLVRFSDYSQSYVEYSRVGETDVWSRLRYQASYNTVDDLEGTAESLVGAWIEGEPMVRAVDPAELLAVMEQVAASPTGTPIA